MEDSLDKSMKELDIAYNNYFKAVKEEKWNRIQELWELHCSQYSPAYLSGDPLYMIIGKDFKKGYFRYLLRNIKPQNKYGF